MPHCLDRWLGWLVKDRPRHEKPLVEFVGSSGGWRCAAEDIWKVVFPFSGLAPMHDAAANMEIPTACDTAVISPANTCGSGSFEQSTPRLLTRKGHRSARI